jgi:hypothetical protein
MEIAYLTGNFRKQKWSKKGERREKNDKGCIKKWVSAVGNRTPSCRGDFENLCRTCLSVEPLKNGRAQMFIQWRLSSVVESHPRALSPWHFQNALTTGFASPNAREISQAENRSMHWLCSPRLQVNSEAGSKVMVCVIHIFYLNLWPLTCSLKWKE